GRSDEQLREERRMASRMTSRRSAACLSASLGALIVSLLLEGTIIAQDCSILDLQFPTASVTATQDRDRMLCLLGIKFPTLPPRTEDPNRPVNAWPRDSANPEGNWTDPRGHLVTRTPFGLWTT